MAAAHLKTALPNYQQRPTLRIPPPAPAPHHYPQKGDAQPQSSPPPAAAPQPKAIPQLGLAELMFHNAIRDGAKIELTFLDGTSLTAAPVALSSYNFLVRDGDGELVIFKHALRNIRSRK
jgi:sRNA-binding regulator protein Hfq